MKASIPGARWEAAQTSDWLPAKETLHGAADPILLDERDRSLVED
ncbi:MAG TPA: hypothetical protein VD902_02280 [Symbiobacteriaceae bacterium]|nr:hypothetical protein [Symbiobacteriaceae bacterium]